MNDKAIVAAIIGVILAGVVGGFSYVWRHIEANAIISKEDRVYQTEVVRPTLTDHEGRLRAIEKCDPECD